QEQGNLDYMVRSLAEADGLLKKRDKPGRIYFIIAQVYQKLGFESEAYQYYKKCIGTNPAYEIDFYARLYMAQVTEISRSRSVAAARKSFRKLLKDSKNKDFRDKIHYEMGMFELKQKNLDEAISEFNMALRLGKNTQVDGEAYLRLGEIYYDTLKQYALSSAYYDSAINSLSKDYEGYAAIKERQEILNEFVKNLNIIQQQDSLLKLSALDSASLHQMVDSAFQARKRIAELETKNTKKRSRRVQITTAASDNVFASIGEDGENSFGSQQSAGGAWYFYNPTATAIGQTEFRRIWGDVALEDNWRRSQRSSSGNVRQSRTQESATPDQASPQEEEAPADDPVIARSEERR